MKQTDGLFHQVFKEIALEYPEIETEHWIIDIGAALIADSPEKFDVIVMGNLYGDIVSDIAAQITGSVGLAGSANIGEECAMFEAIHGSAPTIAGQNIANPSGLLQGAIQMLAHIGQVENAEKIQNAWLYTIENGVHTADIYKEGLSSQKVGTQEFADAVIANLGKKPSSLKAVVYEKASSMNLKKYVRKPAKQKELVGVDLFVHWSGSDPNVLAEKIHQLGVESSELSMITNRGIKVYPDGFPETFCTDHWRCRFKNPKGAFHKKQILDLLSRSESIGLDVIKTENLYHFDGKPAFSLGQGQ